MQGHDFCFVQNTFTLEIDEQLLNAIQLDSITCQASNGRGHAAHAVTLSGNLMLLGEFADFVRNAASGWTSHLKPSFSPSEHSMALAL
ncbi:hypothetical protein NZ35_20805 [Pseudomonas chlororaphis]|uniref:Uncharacterized protein n=1 Tax=Pseudomonas chlororaphis TaxID=587753 RepID=A0A0A6D9F6_9PSED|nr:hypothetical protein NZ35_20805 [Pseudomonas chlororaphis]